jgi:hypothetical protein
MGLGIPAGVRADEHEPLRAAQHELKIARDHLQRAGKDYAGRRKNALDHVNQALVEIRLALQAARGEPKQDGGDEAD